MARRLFGFGAAVLAMVAVEAVEQLAGLGDTGFFAGWMAAFVYLEVVYEMRERAR